MVFSPHSSQTCPDYDVKPSFTQITVAISVGLLFIVVFHFRLKQSRDRKIIPRIRLSRASHVPKLERFSHYVGNNNVCFSISFRLYAWIHKHVSFWKYVANIMLFSEATTTIIGLNKICFIIQHFPYSKFSDLLQLGKWGSKTEDFVPIYVD